MPLVSDLTTVRDILDRDRTWAAYAIGDLAPGFRDHCEWHVTADRMALLLVYRGFTPPIVFAMGAAGALCGLVREVRAPDISLHVQPPALEALSEVYAPTETRAMRRMVLRPEVFRPARHEDVREIGPGDLAAVSALLEHGHRHGDAPTFFHASMLGQRTFRGVWEHGLLVAIAGTHLYSAELGVCAVGNVYTRSDCRRRGLAAAVTSAVVEFAIAQGVATIVLNVSRENVEAARVYQRLGFEHYCDFVEGEARRIGHPDVDSPA